MPENPSNNLSFDHIDGFEVFFVFRIQISSYIPLLQKGTTAGFPALGSSHNHLWLWDTLEHAQLMVQSITYSIMFLSHPASFLMIKWLIFIFHSFVNIFATNFKAC